MAQISKYVRDALKAQLSAVGTGFNDRLAAIATTYGIGAWTVDWSAESTNFLFGRVNPQAIEESSVLTYPLLTIDTLRSQHTNRVKFATFAGPVQAIVEVHHSWQQESVLADFASWVDATEDAMVAALNDQSAQFWPGNLLWAGQVALQRGPIAMGGYGWLQTAVFACNFELIA
jgi:hypothetical protein